jgi:hypothetical protein
LVYVTGVFQPVFPRLIILQSVPVVVAHQLLAAVVAADKL